MSEVSTPEQQETLVEIMRTRQRLLDLTPKVIAALREELEETERELAELRTPWYKKLWRKHSGHRLHVCKPR